MHAELMLAGPLAAETRLPALELLLARGRASARDPRGALAWLGEACGLDPLPAGALTASAEGFWVRADPVHYELLRDRVVLVPVSGLEAAYAARLVETLNRHFAGRHEFRAPHPDAWAMSSAPAALDAPATVEVSGRDLRARLPGAPWAALLNEIQMALHEHPASAGRAMEVNGVWLWGAGEAPRAAHAPWRSIAAQDPLASGLARLAGVGHRAPPESAGGWLASLAGEGRHLAVLGAPDAALEARWFAPLLAALREERIGMLTLHAPESGLDVETTRLDLRRFWRRPRPLARHAAR